MCVLPERAGEAAGRVGLRRAKAGEAVRRMTQSGADALVRAGPPGPAALACEEAGEGMSARPAPNCASINEVWTQHTSGLSQPAR